ncbi:hypothetical protein EXM22_01205 [Oceanispirochaeta crateris]|uniref:VWFA domain-containing protein n=1 Tax=Oceanispirochaeta crateris TaxID=2518645 RepID=A0A5C1QJB5_9SPIO|nr:hypothetical protein [Oceanispirochaeta crateris]QEN06674.1 hypothetical protein EXM22_01205 [Oceanispirochaeta crateris]
MIDFKPLILLFFFFFSALLPAQQNQVSDSVAIRAAEELRWGVISYHQGLYNKAILSFEKSLAMDNDNDLTRFWLGRSYYQSGFEEAALNEWDNIISGGNAGSALLSFVEIITDRRGLARELKSSGKLVELFEIPREQAGINYYNRPVSVAASPKRDGSFYLLSYLNGNLIRITTTGRIHHVLAGGLLGFDRPWDIAFLPDDNLVISEYGADQISVCSPDGFRVLTIGSKGREPGQLLGPQYLAVSEDGYIYVSEWGNRRISKFNLEGEFILSFGERRADYSGLAGPSGIALRNGNVYVADSKTGRIEVFDESGNYLKPLIREGLTSPEGLLFTSDDSLLIADAGRIMVYNLENDVLAVSSDLGGKGKRVLSICQDENGNIISADFDRNSVSVMTDVSTLYAGLFLRINRVVTDEYPQVHVDFTVEDRWGKPVVGLDKLNFFIREKDRNIENFEMSYTGYDNNDLSLAVVVDKSSRLQSRDEVMRDGVRELFRHLNPGDEHYLIGAMDAPQLLAEPGDNTLDALERMMDGWSPESDVASSLRLGASHLIPGRKRKALVFLTDGNIHPDTFIRYGLQDMAQYMKNNGISFYPVYLDAQKRNDELDFIARETGGTSQYLFQPRGILPLLEQVRSDVNGYYTVSYDSLAYTDFGRAYIPLSLEVNFIKKSGRDEMGFYAPLEY